MVVSGGLSSFAIFASSNPATRLWGGDVAEEGIVSGGARGGRDAVAEVREEVDLVVVGRDHAECAGRVARGEGEVRSGTAA